MYSPHIVLLVLHLVAFVASRSTARTDNLEWTGYTYCDANSFVNGISPIFRVRTNKPGTQPRDKRNSNSEDTSFPIVGLNVSCISVEGNGSTFFEEIPIFYNNVNHKLSDFTSQLETCEESNSSVIYGMAVGLEKRFTLANNSDSKSLIDLAFYCNDKDELTKIQEMNRNFAVMGPRWDVPDFCPWGEYICGVNVLYETKNHTIQDFNMACCSLFKESFGWTNYRGATDGKVIESIQMISDEELQQSMKHRSQLHYVKELDDPYYFQWEFCPEETYVTGLQGQLSSRQFRISCSDISKPKPRTKTFLQTQDDIWAREDLLSKHVECEGVVIGFQILYEEITKQIQGVKFFCSFSKEEGQLSYAKVILPPTNNTKAKYSWGDEQMCGRHQALCGFKTKAIKDKDENVLGTEHFKAKCCSVPTVAEICSPYDDYEMVVECDARKAMADTTCQYTLSEGMTYSETFSKSHRQGEDMRNSLSSEWSLSENQLTRQTEESGGTLTISESTGTQITGSKTTGVSSGNTQIGTVSNSNSYGTTSNNGQIVSHGTNSGSTISSGHDKTKTTSNSDSFSRLLGQSRGGSVANTVGQSENFLNTNSHGRSFSDSNADTVGSSRGSVSATTVGSSNSRTRGQTETDSSSSSSTSGRSDSRGTSSSSTNSQSLSVGAEVGVNAWIFSASVKTNLETSFSQTRGSTSESSRHSSTTNSNEHSVSRNSQDTSENSVSNMDQQTSEHTNSNVKTTGSETNAQVSAANGGEKNKQNVNTRNHEINEQHTHGGQHEESSAATERENNEKTVGQTRQTNVERSNSINIQRSSEVSRANHRTTSREDSSTTTTTGSKESSRTGSTTNSKSFGNEKGLTKGRNGGETKDRSFSTGFDWSHTSGHTWTTEKSYQVHMTVPAGYRTRLYQVVGYCAHFQVRTNNFKREDDLANWVKKDIEHDTSLKKVVAKLE